MFFYKDFTSFLWPAQQSQADRSRILQAGNSLQMQWLSPFSRFLTHYDQFVLLSQY